MDFSPPLDRQRLFELVGLLSDEVISDEQFRELEQILESSKKARTLYLNYIAMARNLDREIGVNKNDLKEERQPTATHSTPTVAPILPSHSSSDATQPPVQFGSWNQIRNTGFAIALLLICGLAWLLSSKPPANVARNISYAKVLGLTNVTWRTNEDRYAVGDLLAKNQLEFHSGVIHIRFNSGASVAVQGPAKFEIIDDNHGFLYEGQIAVHVPQNAIGFQVDTPQAEVVDLGTEFGLHVDPHGESQLHVFSGEVEYSAAGSKSQRVSLTTGLAVAVDSNGDARPVELKERSFEVPRKVLWTRYPYSMSISTQFIAGNSSEIAGGVPGRIGGGWTSQWAFDCENGEIDADRTLVRNDNPLGPGLDNHLDIVAKNPDGGKFTLKVHRGFESIGDKFDCRENYILQFLLRLNSDSSNIQQIKISDSSFDQSVSRHAWKLNATRIPNQQGRGDLRWRGLPLKSLNEEDALRVRKWSNENPSSQTKSNRRVTTGEMLRVVVEVEPKNNRYRISLSDGKATLVGDWVKDIVRARTSDRLERRIQWLFEAKDEISVSLDSIRIQNVANFDN